MYAPVVRFQLSGIHVYKTLLGFPRVPRVASINARECTCLLCFSFQIVTNATENAGKVLDLRNHGKYSAGRCESVGSKDATWQIQNII